MKIRELSLRNFRVFSERPPFEFTDRFTVVAGINGKGKTALLDGLAILCSRFLPHVLRVRSGYRRMAPSDVHVGEMEAKLSISSFGVRLGRKISNNVLNY